MDNLENCYIQTNHTISINDTQQPSSYEKNKVLFWCFATVCVIITIITIIGNGIVVIASHQTRNNNRLRHLDGVVKSLAVTDFLFGLFGAPLVALNYYLGKCNLFLFSLTIDAILIIFHFISMTKKIILIYFLCQLEMTSLKRVHMRKK